LYSSIGRGSLGLVGRLFADRFPTSAFLFDHRAIVFLRLSARHTEGPPFVGAEMLRKEHDPTNMRCVVGECAIECLHHGMWFMRNVDLPGCAFRPQRVEGAVA